MAARERTIVTAKVTHSLRVVSAETLGLMRDIPLYVNDKRGIHLGRVLEGHICPVDRQLRADFEVYDGLKDSQIGKELSLLIAQKQLSGFFLCHDVQSLAPVELSVHDTGGIHGHAFEWCYASRAQYEE